MRRSKPRAMPPCGGRAVAERFEHVAEAQLGFFRRDLEDVLEHRLLHVGLVDADAAAAEFQPLTTMS